MIRLPLCPHDDALHRFARSRADDPEYDRIEQHLLLCRSCADRLDAVAPDDAVASGVQRLAAAPPTSDPPALRELMARLGHLFPAEANASLPTRGPSAATPTGDSVTFEPDVPLSLGGYRLLKVLGQGGMGTVYLAEDSQLQRHIAVKVMRSRVMELPGARERFLREARAAAAFQHDHVVAVFQVGEDGGVPFIAMPLLQGETLSQRLESDPAVTLAEAVRIGRETAEGLAAAHARGLVHRDIKPANLWLEERPGAAPRVKILDFGLALPPHTDEKLTPTGGQVGTPGYMAPEQWHGTAVDGRADLFSLGVVLYRLLTGRPPFPGRSILEVGRAVAVDTPPAPRRLNDAVPAELSSLVMRLLAKTPEERTLTATEVARSLAGLEQSLSESRPIQPRRSRWRRRVWAAPLLGVLLLAGVWGFNVRGRLIIDNDDPSTPITIRRAGNIVFQGQFKGEVRLPPGEYDLELEDKPGGPTMLKQRVTIKHFGADTRIRLEAFRVSEPPSRTAFDDLQRQDLAAEKLAKLGISALPKALPELVGLFGDARLNAWGYVRCLTFSPTGGEVAVGTDNGTVTLWDVKTGQVVQQLATPVQVMALAFSPDGEQLAVGRMVGVGANLVTIWNLRDRRCFDLPGRSEAVKAVAFSPDGKTVAAAFGTTLTVQRIADKQLLHTFAGHTQPVGHLVFSPDGSCLVSGAVPNADGKVELKVWELRPQQPEINVEGHRGKILALTFSQDGRRLASADSSGRTSVWEAGSWKSLGWQELPERRPVSLAFSRDLKRVAVGDEQANVSLWELATRTRLWQQRGGQLDAGLLAFSPSDDVLASAECEAGVRLWDTRKGGESLPKRAGHAGPVSALVTTPDGSKLITASRDRTVRVQAVDATKGAAAPLVLDSSVLFRDLVVSADGKYAAGLARDGKTLHVLDVERRQWVAALRDCQPECCGIGFSADGRFLAFAALGGKVKVWGLASGRLYALLEGHEAGVKALSFSPDGRWLVSGGFRGTVKIWDLQQRKEAEPCKGHGDDVHAIAFSPDGRTFATASHDRTVKVWDRATGRELLRLEGHEWLVVDVAYSPDGKSIASSSRDGTARVWDAATGERQRTFRLAADGVHNLRVRFSPEGRHLLTGNADGTVYVLRLAE